ncbi:hypothetical protein Peur_009236 [Populus x canadensis]
MGATRYRDTYANGQCHKLPYKAMVRFPYTFAQKENKKALLFLVTLTEFVKILSMQGVVIFCVNTNLNTCFLQYCHYDYNCPLTQRRTVGEERCTTSLSDNPVMGLSRHAHDSLPFALEGVV